MKFPLHSLHTWRREMSACLTSSCLCSVSFYTQFLVLSPVQPWCMAMEPSCCQFPGREKFVPFLPYGNRDYGWLGWCRSSRQRWDLASALLLFFPVANRFMAFLIFLLKPCASKAISASESCKLCNGWCVSEPVVRTTLWSMQEGLGGQQVGQPGAHSLSGRGCFAGDGNGGRVLSWWHKAFTLKAVGLWRTSAVSLEGEREIPESLGEDWELCPVLGVEDIQAPKKTGVHRATATSTWHLALSRHQFYRSNPQQLHENPPSPPVPRQFRWHPVFSSKTYFPDLLLYPSSPSGASISICMYCSH